MAGKKVDEVLINKMGTRLHHATQVPMCTVSLLCHPSTPEAAVERIDVQVTSVSPAALALRYIITGAIASLRLPKPAVAQRTDGLWRHTCCELFIASANNSAYREFNFSPSSEWAAYEFDAYRQGMRPLSLTQPPRIAMTHDERWQMDVDLKLDAALHGALLALCAVIERNDGQISYWALQHPRGKPDFHHRDGFVLQL